MTGALARDVPDRSGVVAEKVIGVLGGLGPWATLDFYAKLLRLTPARSDQDHLHVIIDSNAKIPDRSLFIFGQGEDPTPALVATARSLEGRQPDPRPGRGARGARGGRTGYNAMRARYRAGLAFARGFQYTYRQRKRPQDPAP